MSQAENLIPSGAKAAEEAAFIKRHLDALSTQKTRYPDDYTPPDRKRAKRANIANIAVAAPPEPIVASTSEGENAASAVTLAIKSTKPALAYTLKASPTASILSLKEQLAAENGAGAPPADAQRWVLGGKAMADSKLLSEYNVAEGAQVFLMVQKGWTPVQTEAAAGAPPIAAAVMGADVFTVAPPVTGSLAVPTDIPAPAPLPATDFPGTSARSSPSASRGHIRVPSLTLERADSSDSITKRSSPVLTPIDTSTPNAPHPSPAGVSTAFVDQVSSPGFWLDTLGSLRKRFPDEESARKVFENWFSASKVWLTPSQISRIRDTVGISGMGGL